MWQRIDEHKRAAQEQQDGHPSHTCDTCQQHGSRSEERSRWTNPMSHGREKFTPPKVYYSTIIHAPPRVTLPFEQHPSFVYLVACAAFTDQPDRPHARLSPPMFSHPCGGTPLRIVAMALTAWVALSSAVSLPKQNPHGAIARLSPSFLICPQSIVTRQHKRKCEHNSRPSIMQ